MARDQKYKETNVIPGGVLVDENNQVAGFTSRGVDKMLVSYETNPLSTRIR